MVDKLKNLFKINDSYSITKRLLFVIIIAIIFTYSLLIIDYYACPDGVVEGISYFHNADWSLYGGGRWLIRYICLLTGNLVFPLIIVSQYGICSFISSLLLKKIWDIKLEIIIYLMGVIFVCAPTAIFLMTYTYTGLCIGICVCLGILFTYINFNYKGLVSAFISSVIMMLLLSIDQGFIGVASSACLFTIIVKLLKEDDYKDVLSKTIKCLATAIVGGILYIISLNISINIHGFSEINDTRVSTFSFDLILQNFSNKFIETYTTFINYFEDYVFKRKYLFILIFSIVAIVVIIRIINLIKNKKYINVIASVLLLFLLPPVSYVIEIIVPFFNVYLAMEYQCTIVLIFAVAVLELINNKILKVIQILLVTMICWTYILSANATYRCYSISYNRINSEMRIVLDNIYKTDGYIKNVTPIIIAGFPNDIDLREKDKTYRYAISFPTNPVFWEDSTGALYGREKYFAYYLGVDAKDISFDEYKQVVTSKEFDDMGIWPSSNSIKMIDGYCVVKFTDDPPIVY